MILLETPRLLIRDHLDTTIELEGLHRLLTDERAMYFMDDIRAHSKEDSKANLANSLKEAALCLSDERRCFFFAITLKPDTLNAASVLDKEDDSWKGFTYVGEIGYTVRAHTSKGSLVSMGYFILPEFWGKGIMTEAVDRLMSFAFEQHHVWKIELGCNKGNPGSEKVMIKNGMIKEAEFVDHTWLDNRLWNRVEYRMLKDEWLRKQYSESLLNWYEQHHRKLPWRETHDAYHIWISEVMLQQTQVDTVITYYNNFVKRFPTVYDLASADEDLVFKLWEGLGYYSRAKRLMLCSRELVEKYQGVFPQNYDELLKLPGIGPYTAGAISSIAFNLKAPAVDGNVMRVLSRQFRIREDIGLPATRTIFESRVMTMLPEDCRHFNQALMELGATVCTPQNPKCEICPVSKLCEAYRYKVQSELPVKARKVKKSTHEMAIALVRYGNLMLITKRPGEGLLAGLWALPIMEMDEHDEERVAEELRMELKETYGMDVVYQNKHCSGKHVFTHRIWNMTLYVYEAQSLCNVDYPQMVWVDDRELSNYAIPTAFSKMLNEIRRNESD